MVTNLKRNWIVWAFVLGFVGDAAAQTCETAFSVVPSASGVNWRQFPEFRLPFTVIYSGSQQVFDAEAILQRGFTHISNPNSLGGVPVQNRAYIYYGVASGDQPWGKYKSPYGNDMAAYHRKWDDELAYFRSLNGGSNEVDIFCLDIEMHHKSRDSILVLKTMDFVPAELRTLSNDDFVARYQRDMQKLYADAARYIRERVKTRYFTAYGDVPVFNTFTNLQGPTWAEWQSDPAQLNYIAYDFEKQKAGGSYYDQLDVLSPNAYFYYDYPHIFAGEYLSYLMFQPEVNRVWSDRDQWLFLWSRYSYTPQYAGKSIRPWMAEAMAIFPFFSGATGIWLWDDMGSFADYSGYEYFMKGLYRLSTFRHFFEGNYELVQTISARDYNENKLPVWRGVYKDGRLLVAAQNPWASSENEEVKLTINYGNLRETLTLRGYEIVLCDYAADPVAANEPTDGSLLVYPNPVSEVLTYRVQTGGEPNLQLTLLDEHGRVLHREELHTKGAAEYTGELRLGSFVAARLYLQVKGRLYQRVKEIIVLP